MAFQRSRFGQHPHLFGSQTTGEQDDLAMLELSASHHHNKNDSMHSESQEWFWGSHVFDSPKNTTTNKKTTQSVIPGAARPATQPANDITANSTTSQADAGTASKPITIDDATPDNIKIRAKDTTIAAAVASTTTVTKKPTFRPVKLSKAKTSKTAPKEAPTPQPPVLTASSSTTTNKMATEMKKSRKNKKGKAKGGGRPQHANTSRSFAVNRRKPKQEKNKKKQKKAFLTNNISMQGAAADYSFVDPVGSNRAVTARRSLQHVSAKDIPFEDSSEGNLRRHDEDALLTDGLFNDLPNVIHHNQQVLGNNSYAGSNASNGKKRKRNTTQQDTGAFPDYTPSRNAASAPSNSNQRHSLHPNRQWNHWQRIGFRTNNSSRPPQQHQFGPPLLPPHPQPFFYDNNPRGHPNGDWRKHQSSNALQQSQQTHPSSFPSRGQQPPMKGVSSRDNVKSRSETMRHDVEAEAKKQAEQEKELRACAEAKAKAAEARAAEASKEIETLRLENCNLRADFEAKSKTMEMEKVKMEEAKSVAEAKAREMATAADRKSKEAEKLNLQVKELSSEVEAVKKAQERMRVRLQKEAERKVAIEAKVLADVTQKLREEQDARAEVMKAAIANSEKAKKKTEEMEALKQEFTTLKARNEAMQSTALNGILQMQKDSKQRADEDAQKIARLAHLLRQEQKARLAAAAEAIATSAEAEKIAQEAAVLRHEVNRLKAEANQESVKVESKREDGSTSHTAFIVDECLDDFDSMGGVNAAMNEKEGGKKNASQDGISELGGSSRPVAATSSRPTFRPKRVKKSEKANKKSTEARELPRDGRSSPENRFVFSNEKPNAGTDSSTNTSFAKQQQQASCKPDPSHFPVWEENSDEALREQERLLNAAKAKMRTQHARQARVMPGNGKLKASSIPDRTFAALVRDVHIQYPDHWQYKNLYARLGLPRSASDAMIKSQYRRLALQYHPDRNSHCEESKNRFQAVTEAYETLMHKH